MFKDIFKLIGIGVFIALAFAWVVGCAATITTNKAGDVTAKEYDYLRTTVTNAQGTITITEKYTPKPSWGFSGIMKSMAPVIETAIPVAGTLAK
jgi:predicted choloylglycine hydrolase